MQCSYNADTHRTFLSQSLNHNVTISILAPSVFVKRLLGMSLRRSTRVQALSNTAATMIPQTDGNHNTKLPKSSGKVNAITGDQQDKSAPITPPERQTPRKRQKLDQISPNLPPVTPTPAAVALIMSKTPISKVKAKGNNPPRPAQPHVANAPLNSPASDKLVTAYSTFDGDAVGPAPPASATTSSILDDAVAHLKRMDENGRLAPFIAKFHCKVFDADGLAEEIDPFRSLSSGIIAQQVSGAAATSIKNKFVALFEPSEKYSYGGPPSFPPPGLVAATPITVLRTAGLSQRKAEYIQGLAMQFDTGKLSAEMLAKASDQEVMDKLIAVRGLGKWSVEMFASFSLKRMDVFSTGDLGVQRGLAVYMGKDVSKLKAGGGGKWKYMGSEKAMLDAAAKFSPYR
jgi:DNA-3-methyladenine glycosylase II